MHPSHRLRTTGVPAALIILVAVGTATAQTTVPPPGPALPPTSATATIAGRVTDEDGKPIHGVAVRIVGEMKGAITKADGSFTIGNVRRGDYTLRVTSIGMQPRSELVRIHDGINTFEMSMVKKLQPSGPIFICPLPKGMDPAKAGTVRVIRFDN